jgi:polyisoprenoid-binding protein YceI
MAWKIDPAHSSVEFAVRHMVVSTVRGRFDEFSVEAEVDENDVTKSRGTVVVKTASLDTRNDQRDGHLRSPDFFDVEAYPEMTFVITGVEGSATDLRISGDLTIKDVTHPITLAGEVTGPVVDPWGATRLGLSVLGKIVRQDYGLTWNVVTEAGGVLVGDDVKISIEAEFEKVAETADREPAAAAGAGG